MQTLDVVIGLAFIYLLLSLACTALNEIVSQWMNWRAATLRQGITHLLTGDASGLAASKVKALRDALTERESAASALVAGARASSEYQTYATALAALGAAREEVLRAASSGSSSAATSDAARSARLAAEAALDSARRALDAKEPGLPQRLEAASDAVRAARAAYAAAGVHLHPLIAGLSQLRRTMIGRRAEGGMPSYIPARTFAIALLDSLAPATGDGSHSIAELRDTVGHLPPTLRQPLTIFLDDAAADVEQLRTRVARWYEDAMERVSGLYKRKTQLSILLIALGVTLFTNANTLRIAHALATNATLREGLVARAEATVAKPSPTVQALLGAGGASTPVASDTSTRASAPAAADPAARAAIAADSARRARLDEILGDVGTLGLPIGYRLSAADSVRLAAAPWYQHPYVGASIYAPQAWDGLVGLLVTTLAISLGAPFWFDMLNKFINIRAAGRAPEERPKPPEALPPAQGA